jgi:hypothetical protein
MATKNQNPYHRGNYMAMFAFLMTFKGKAEITRTALINFCVDTLGMFTHTAVASSTVVLSPREIDGRGDCRGNRSAAGDKYYMNMPARRLLTADGNPAKYKTVDGNEIGMHKVDGKWAEYDGDITLEEQRYQLKFRKVALPELNNDTAGMSYEDATAYLNAKAEAKAERKAELAEIEADKETARKERATAKALKLKTDAEAKVAKEKAKAQKAIDKAKATAKLEADKAKAKADKAIAKATADKLKADAQAEKVKEREAARTKRLAEAEAAKALKAKERADKQAQRAKKAADKLAEATAKVEAAESKANELSAELAQIAEDAKEAHAEKMDTVIPSETDDVETEDDTEGELAEA